MKARNPRSESAVRAAANMPNTFDQLAARAHNEEELSLLRDIQHDEHSAELQQHFRQFLDRKVTRVMLGAIADPAFNGVFVATVAGRGFRGSKRTVLLKGLRLFGNKIVLAGHLWLPYDRRWERLEPFFQGCKVVLVGKIAEYTRGRDGTVDYTLNLERVSTLWNHPHKTNAN